MTTDRLELFKEILNGLGRSHNTIKAYLSDLVIFLPTVETEDYQGVQKAVIELTKRNYSPSFQHFFA